MNGYIVVAAIAFFAAASRKKNAKGAPLKVDPAAEESACAIAAEDRPAEWEGIARGGLEEVDWLSRVAFHLAYNRWPDDAAPADAERLILISACVAVRLPQAGPGIDLDAPPPLPPIATSPTPGWYYAIKPGDTLFKISSLAYGTKPATQANYQAAKRINEAQQNLRFRRIVESEKGLFPQGRITFYPIFGAFAAQLADATDGSEGQGNNYAVIWIPEA